MTTRPSEPSKMEALPPNVTAHTQGASSFRLSETCTAAVVCLGWFSSIQVGESVLFDCGRFR
jgi:hypothetical protein